MVINIIVVVLTGVNWGEWREGIRGGDLGEEEEEGEGEEEQEAILDVWGVIGLDAI